MQTLTQPRSANTSRFWLIGACALGFALFLGLLAYIFARYPDAALSTGTGPKANIPLWFGANGAAITYLLLGVLLAGLYIYVSVQGTSQRGVWRTGAVFGAALGVVWLLVGVINVFISVTPLELALDGALLILPIVAGALGASQTGRFGDGPLAGFWCGLAAALLIALAIIAIDTGFAAHLSQTSWLQDRQCNAHTGDALAACEISDDLGLAASLVVALPILMAGLGAIGGTIGIASTRGQRREAMPTTANPSRAPLFFSLIIVALIAAELLFNLW